MKVEGCECRKELCVCNIFPPTEAQRFSEWNAASARERVGIVRVEGTSFDIAAWVDLLRAPPVRKKWEGDL